MRITQIRLKNFMPYFGDQSLDLPSDEFRNVVLVFGDNMRGKTSLMNALRWAFYGTAIDRYGQDIPLVKLVNSDASKDGEWSVSVGVNFEHEDRRYELRREATRRTGVSHPQRAEDFLIQEWLRIEGEVVRGDQIVHVINRIVPKQISRFFLFDGELLQEYEALLAEDNEQGRRIKESIEQVLGVPSLINGKSDLKVLRKPFDKAWQQDLKQNDAVKQFSEKLAESEREADRLETDAQQQVESLADMKRHQSVLQAQMDEAQNQYTQKTELDQHKHRLDQIGAEKDALDQRRLSAIKGAWLDLLQPTLAKEVGARQARILELTETLSNLALEDAEVLQRVIDSSQCSLCHQTVGGDVLAGIRARLASATTGQRESVLSDLATLQGSLRQLISVPRPGAQHKLKEIDAAFARLTVEETQLIDKVDDLKEQLASFDSDRIARVRRDSENGAAAIKMAEARLEVARASLVEVERSKEWQDRRADLSA